MTPKLAEAVDPVFLTLVPILDRLGASEGIESAYGSLTASDMRRRLEDVLRAADRLMASEGKDWREFGKYAVVAWIDEMLGLAHEWPGQAEWKDQPLELLLREFSTRESNEEFYKRASRAPSEANADTIEMYYVCAMLGFVGLYRDPNSAEGRSQIERLSLPPNLASWTDDYGKMVKQARGGKGRDSNERPDRSITPATPHWRTSCLVWPMVLGIICAGVNVLAWWGWWT